MFSQYIFKQIKRIVYDLNYIKIKFVRDGKYVQLSGKKRFKKTFFSLLKVGKRNERLLLSLINIFHDN